MKETPRTLTLAPEDNLTRYLQEIRTFPMLTAEQEQDLGRRWRDGRDPEAVRLLVGSHLRLVVKIARGFAGYGLPLAELIGEGNVGLMQAVEKFEPERGFRLATYAAWWIRAAIQEHILRNWSLVRMGTTAAQKKLFFNLRRLKAELEAYEEGDLPPEALTKIARELDVTETEVLEMNRRLTQGDRSLNTPIGEDGDSEWQDLLVDETRNQEVQIAEADELAWRRGLLQQGLEHLNERERHILTERRLKEQPLTLEELSHQYGVSRERVRQIEERAFQKLQKAMKSHALLFGPAARMAA